jgi:1,4-alpha-glucan branching enzyme
MINLDEWNRDSHPMTKDEFGCFDITLPAVDGQPAIPHKSKLKVVSNVCATISFATG